jgi:PAS domain S-box-containing protein
MLTGLNDDALALQAVQIGVQDYLVKGKVNGDLLERTIRYSIQRKQAETTLQEKVEGLRRMATVVSDSNDAVILHDFDGKILAWNRGAKETYGYSEAEAMKMNVRDIVAEPDREAALTLIKKIKQGEVVKSFELRRVTKDNRILDVWLTTTLLTDEKGKPVAIATTERDITERKKAEINLQEKMEDLRRMATVVSDSNDAVILHDFNGKILAWNRGAKETYGYSEAEAMRMNVRDIVAKPDREAALTLIKKIQHGEVVKSFELRRVTKDNRILDVWLTTTLLTDEDGKSVAIATTERDITELKQNQIEIQKSLIKLRKTIEETIVTVARIVDVRDPYTAGHQKRVASISVAIAQGLGLTEEQIRGIYLASLIHDIGKIQVPAEILSKPGKLTKLEFALIKIHPRVGYDLLKGIDFPWPIAQIVYQHHERIDGSGYPRKLKGDKILLEARIVGIADVIEAISSHRPYRPALGIDFALEEVKKHSGITFDTAVVKSCMKIFKNGYQLEKP